MGANLVADGATFRVWAGSARRVYVALGGADGYVPRSEDELVKDASSGHWMGFFTGVRDGTKYRYVVEGAGGDRGFKRDPWARELEFGDFTSTDCIVRPSDSYPWHDDAYRPPAFSELVVYQFHVGVFYARDEHGADRRPHRVAKLLDALDRVEYLAELGVNAVQPLPLVEFRGEWSLGYNGTDLFSPETDYCVAPTDLDPYVAKVSALLVGRHCAPLTGAQLTGQVNQLKAFVDVCHLYGLAVIPDVVYNHAGGNLDEQSLDYFDLPPARRPDNNLYFSGAEWAGGRVFDYLKPEVREFLIGNSTILLEEYHADGLRFDEVTVIDRNVGGWDFCQRLTRRLDDVKPRAALIAEYWGEQPWRAVARPPDGMGFDLAYNDRLRNCIRDLLAQAAGGAFAHLDLHRLECALETPPGFEGAWRAYNCIENQDLVLDADGDHRKPRISALADATDARSWYARSRSRVATGLLLTAPGVPMLFMGQEFLEDKLWSDDPNQTNGMIWWDGLAEDRHMRDFQRFVRELIALRARQPALRSDGLHVHAVDEQARIIAFHRWVPGEGHDVVVVASLSESTIYDGAYRLGMPYSGPWFETHNSDLFDHYKNPWVQGNFGMISADGPSAHGMPHSVALTVPANALLVFARDEGP